MARCEFTKKMKAVFVGDERRALVRAYTGLGMDKTQREEWMPRIYWGLKFEGREDFFVSVQASAMHQCEPQRTVAIGRYTAFEVAFVASKRYLSAGDVFGEGSELADEFREFAIAVDDGGVIYGRVPKELVERAYQWCVAKFGKCVNGATNKDL